MQRENLHANELIMEQEIVQTEEHDQTDPMDQEPVGGAALIMFFNTKRKRKSPLVYFIMHSVLRIWLKSKLIGF